MQYIIKSMLKHISTILIVVAVCAGGYTFAQHENIIGSSDSKSEVVSDDFAHNHIRPDAPNSVKGVKNVAKEGDYVLLRGVFVRRADAGVYEFHDEPLVIRKSFQPQNQLLHLQVQRYHRSNLFL